MVLSVPPSPKSQSRLVIVPDEVSVKVTSKGANPLVGVPLKLATGTSAPVPITAFVALPPFAVVNRALLLMLFRDDGDKLPYEEVARRLGVAVGSIGPTRARCLGKLRGLVDNVPGAK